MVMIDRKDRMDWTKGKNRKKGMDKVDRKDRAKVSNEKEKKSEMGKKVDRIDRARSRGTMITKFLKNF